MHNDVDYAAQCAAVLRLDAGGVHDHFVDEVEGHIRVRVAADELGRLLAFHQIGVLGVRAAGDRITECVAVLPLPGEVAPLPLPMLNIDMPSRGSLRAAGAN